MNETTKKPIPGYYSEYLDEKIKKINNIKKNVTPFIFETDFHTLYNSMLSPSLAIKLAKECEVSLFISGGDYPYAFGKKEDCIKHTEEAIDCLECVKDVMKLLIVRGNHDMTIKINETEGYTHSYEKTRNLLMGANSDGAFYSNDRMYYYYDDTESKVRYIILDTMDVEQLGEDAFWGVLNGIGEEETKWLCNIALNIPNDDWSVIGVGHIPIVKELHGYDESLDVVAEIFKAYKNKRQCKYGNFEDAKGEFVAYICGHGHKDQDVLSDGTLFVETGCDACFFDDIWDRKNKTVSDVLFDVFVINKNEKKLCAVRIGAGEDRTFDY